MSLPSFRSALLVACTLAASAPLAHAQSRDWEREEAAARRRRVEREREVERERQLERQARERRLAEQRREEERERAARSARERVVRSVVVHRDDSWRNSYRPRLSLGAGFDVRRFGDDDARYLGQAGIDFRSRSGLGIRPEVLFGWTDRAERVLTEPATCLSCAGGQPLAQFAPVVATGRSRMLGVAVSGTYTFMRSSPVRPYLISGIGVITTRTLRPEIIITSPGDAPQYTTRAGYRNDVDVGLNAGGGLELDAGPIRLFTEFRYLLNDDARPLGFSGSLPLVFGLRL